MKENSLPGTGDKICLRKERAWKKLRKARVEGKHNVRWDMRVDGLYVILATVVYLVFILKAMRSWMILLAQWYNLIYASENYPSCSVGKRLEKARVYLWRLVRGLMQ